MVSFDTGHANFTFSSLCLSPVVRVISIIRRLNIIHVHVSRKPISRKSSTLPTTSSKSHHPLQSCPFVWLSVDCKDVGVSLEELLRGRGSAGEASPIWCYGDERAALYPLDPERTSGLFSSVLIKVLFGF